MNTKRTYSPTCPIDRDKVNKIARSRIIFASAIVLTGSLAVAGLLIYAQMMSDTLATVTSLSAGLAAIVANACTRRTTIQNGIVQRMIATSNAEQEYRLRQVASRLRSPANAHSLETVSYTHLTLPTIYSV